MSFSQNDNTILTSASPQAIKEAFGETVNQWNSSRWIAHDNRYRKDCINRLRNDLASGRPGKMHQKQLRLYIASSACVHCFDGWSYLARALTSFLHGDPDTSRHLAYYAELRAALSFLSAQGIGVFDSQHFAVDTRGRCSKFAANKGTHIFACEALQGWAALPDSADTIFRLIKPGGIPLSEWLDHFSIGTASRNILAKDWLIAWGLDLQRLSYDRAARNLVSYRPTAFNETDVLPVSEVLAFVRELWLMCEPTSSLGFSVLDRHLLRYSLSFYFKKTHAYGRTALQARREFRKRIESLLHFVRPIGFSDAQWKDFLQYRDGQVDSPILLTAGKSNEPHNPQHTKQVLARAVLLLRLSIGACGDLLSTNSDATKERLYFWWYNYGLIRGLWSQDKPPDDFRDLWEDIQEAIDEFASVEEPCISYFDLHNSNAASAAALSSCERIFLWGLGI